MKTRRYCSIFLVLVLVVGLLAGCSKRPAADSNGYYDNAKVEESFEVVTDSSTGGSIDLPENQKWIRTVYLDAETENLDPLLQAVNEQVSALGGYIESRDIYHGSQYYGKGRRYAQLVIRIPVAQTDAFTGKISEVSNITATNETVENITLAYVDTESRVAALKTEQTRLLELMEKAETMADLLEIESRLTDVRYELEKMTSQLRVYDNLVDFATIHLDISEVEVLTPVEEETLWQRISGGFVESVEKLGNGLLNFFVWLLVKLPYLALVALIAGVVLLSIRSGKKRKKNRKEKAPLEKDHPAEG